MGGTLVPPDGVANDYGDHSVRPDWSEENGLSCRADASSRTAARPPFVLASLDARAEIARLVRGEMTVRPHRGRATWRWPRQDPAFQTVTKISLDAYMAWLAPIRRSSVGAMSSWSRP